MHSMGDVDCGALLRFPALAPTSSQGCDESVMLPISSCHGELWARAQGCDAAVVMVKHDVYEQLDLGALKDALRTPVVVDGRWQVFEVEDARPADKLRGRDCVGF